MTSARLNLKYAICLVVTLSALILSCRNSKDDEKEAEGDEPKRALQPKNQDSEAVKKLTLDQELCKSLSTHTSLGTKYARVIDLLCANDAKVLTSLGAESAYFQGGADNKLRTKYDTDKNTVFQSWQSMKIPNKKPELFVSYLALEIKNQTKFAAAFTPPPSVTWTVTDETDGITSATYFNDYYKPDFILETKAKAISVASGLGENIWAFGILAEEKGKWIDRYEELSLVRIINKENFEVIRAFNIELDCQANYDVCVDRMITWSNSEQKRHYYNAAKITAENVNTH